jgi:hypothetical protein
MTAPARAFYIDLHKTLHALGFFYELADRADNVWTILDEMGQEVGSPARDRPPSAVATLKTYSRFLRETIVTRAVDNYLAYLGELLSLVFKARPEALRSPDQIRLDEVLRYDTMEELVANIAERRVANLTQQGVAELDHDLSRLLGIPLFDSAEDRERGTTIVELRNLLVHNRGVIDSRFKRRLPDYPGEVGEDVNVGKVTEHLEFLGTSVQRVDRLISAKYGIERPATRADVLRALRTDAPADALRDGSADRPPLEPPVPRD